MSYVELHARSAFSFLRGGSNPEDLARQASSFELPALALCDRDGLYGAPRLYHAARENGIRALVGCELTMEDESVVPLLVENSTGYQNLCQLITTAQLRSPKGQSRAGWAELAEHAEGLVALTGDEEGPVRRAWKAGGPAAAEVALGRLRAAFDSKHLFVEMQRHLVRGEERELRMLADLAHAHALPLLATNGVAYATPGARTVADVFMCLRHHTTLDGAGTLLALNAERHIKPAKVMNALFSDFPEAIANTARLAERLSFTLKDLGYRFPDYPVAPNETMVDRLKAETYAGANRRFKEVTPEVILQLDRELALIARLGFCGYFLIVWDICKFARDNGILVQGRGSAANSAVCYALGITSVNPIENKLLFERFLSEGRVGADGRPSWPDIDLDFPSGELRERVIQEVYTRYGKRGAAMTANVITYRGRSTVREIGKVLGFPENSLDRFSSLYANGDFPQTLELKEQLSMAGMAPSHPRSSALISLYQQIYGLPRHLGQHSGGMIICQGQLDHIVPLENASMPGRVVAQWDKDDCEDLGIVKVDFLGLGMMAVLQDSLALCKDRGHPMELHQIPQNDEATFEMMRAADTVGVFQIESRAQMATLPRLKPREFYDVAIQVAIIRPGPIVGKLVHPIIKHRKNPHEIPICIDPEVHEKLLPTLGRTSGVILFQEQMLKVAMELGGLNGSEAEELRRALGFHRDNQRLLRAVGKLRAGMKKNGYSEAVTEKICQSAESFALYGFPESHAIGFAQLAYASTWLKVHHAPEFYASLLNNQPMGFYSPATLVQDGRRHGLKTLPVCVHASKWLCTVVSDTSIRLGFKSIKGLSEKAVKVLLAARPFDSMDDFLKRTDFSVADRRALAKTGALNALAEHRRAALWDVEQPVFKDDLLTEAELAVNEAPSPLEPMTPIERIQTDYTQMSLTIGDHPMKLLRSRLPGICRAADLKELPDGKRVSIAGSVICRQRPGTAKGFVFISLEDETGIANAVVIPSLFERQRLRITEEHSLIITGRLQNREGVIHVKAERIEPLREKEVPEQASHDFR